jgi:hypothetical protein
VLTIYDSQERGEIANSCKYRQNTDEEKRKEEKEKAIFIVVNLKPIS